MEHQLAIIIPAYKPRFFKQTLDSLANQSRKDFTLYIGDDASKDDLYSIIKPFNSKLNIVYKKFDENLGQTSLTKQWERCINLSKNETYVWLFSDDDEMSSNAVEKFYSEILKSNKFNIYRFDLKIIDDRGEFLSETKYPEVQTNVDFFKSRLQESIYSCVTNCILKREEFISKSGFVEFPVAWFSDDASWIKFSENGGFKKIDGAQINWRLAENYNISSSKEFEIQKASAAFKYANWFNNYFSFKVNKKEMQVLTMQFFKKRIFKMPISQIYKLDAIKTIFLKSGFGNGIYLYIYDFQFRFRNQFILKKSN